MHDPHGRAGRAMNRALAQEHSDMVSLYRFLFKLPFLLIALLIRFIVRVIVFLWRKLRRNRQPPGGKRGYSGPC